MTDPKDYPPDFSDLRQRAEARLEVEAIIPEDLSPTEAARLIHELQVHQIELELQNEELRQSQTQLAESRDKYADLYDFAPVGYLTLDERGRIIEANLMAATLLGAERSRLRGRFFSHFLVEADRRVLRQLLDSAPNQDERRGEFHLQDGNGDMRFMLLDILFFRDAEGREQQRIAMTDITELKRVQEELRLHKEDLEELVSERTAELLQANEQLREAKEKFETLFQAAPLAIEEFDARGRIVSVNPASERIFGWSLEEVQGRLPSSIPPEYAEESLRVLQQALQGNAFIGAELKAQRKDGTLFDVSFSAAPRYDQEGNIQGFIGISEDITARMQAGEALRTQAQVLESMAEGVSVTDDRGYIIFTNPAFDAMFGYGPGELVGRHSNILNLYPPEENTRVVKEILHQVNTTGVWIGEFHNCKKDGSPLFTAARISALEVGGKKLFISVQEDITERQRAEKEIRRLASFPELNPNPVLEVDEEGEVVYANPAAREWVEDLQLPEGVKAFLPPGLENLFHEVRQGAARRHAFDLKLQDFTFAITLHFPHDLPTARLYALDITLRKRAEDALALKMAEFEAIFHAISEGVIFADPERRIVLVNPAGETLFGYASEEMQGRTTEFLYTSPEDYEEQGRRRYHTQPDHSLPVYEINYRRKDGSVFPAESKGSQVKDAHGRVIGFVSIHRDITERKQAEHQVETQRRLLETVVHNLPAAVALYRGPDHIFEVVNPAYLAIAPGKKMLGRTFKEVWPEVYAYVGPLLERVLETGETYHAFDEKFLIQRSPTGPLEKAYFSWSLIRIRLPGETGWGILNTAIETTERVRAEEALRESREDLNRAQAVAHTGSWRMNVQKNELTWSDENHRIFGITPGTPMTYETFLGTVHPEDREYVDRKWTATLKGEPYDIEHRIIVDGTVKWVRERAELEFDQDGRLLGGFGTTQDITERRQAEKALQKNREWLAAILGSISDGFIVLDENLKITYFNDAAETLLGRSKGDVLGKSIFEEAFPEARGSIFETYYRLAMREKKPVFFEAYFARPPYENWYDIRAYPHEDGLSVFFQVTTKRKQAEEALRRAHDELENRVAERTAALRLANEQLLWEMEERQEAEDRLRESEARFAAFMQHLPGLAVMRDVQGRYIFANEAWERMARKTRSEWQGKPLEDLWPQEMARRFQQLDQQVLLAGGPLESLETLELADGLHHLLAYRFPIKDKDGLPYMVGAIGIDITRRMQAEEEARRQMRLFEAFFDNTITPLVFLDSHFNFIRVNQAYARACHREVQEFSGRNHFDFYPHDENKAIFQEVVQTRQPYVAVAKAFEFPDHPEWGVTYWDWSLVPILNEAGEVDFLVFSLKEVTEQVQAEEERRRLVEILENTPDFVGIADFHGRLQYLNRAGRALVGVSQDDDISELRVLQLHPDRFGELILQEGSPVARREGAWQAESALLHRDGREIPVSQVILAHCDATGRVQFFSTIARDISDLKEAQENILRQTAILNGINRIFREALTCETEEELGRTCLAVAEELTNSRFGFIDELNEQGTFDALAFSHPGWDLSSMPQVTRLTHLKNIQPVGLLARPIREGKALIDNAPASPPDAVGTPTGYPPLTAYLGTPLIFGARTIGLIGLGNKPGGYTVNDRETIETLAPSIVEALMHHRAKRDLKRSESKLRHLADQLLTAQEDERKRLAAELHDELGHALLALKLAFSSIAKELLPGQEDLKEEIQDQLAYINEVLGEVRRLYQHLSPGDVEDLGLTKALQTLIREFADLQGYITWEVVLPDLDRLFSLAVQTIIYRLVQEALTNIGKHANPEHVTVSARKEGSSVHFAIQDDGAGFDMIEALDSHAGLGLAAMEERLNMVGGSFAVWSKKGEGTRLSFSIPTLSEDDRK